MTGVRVGLDRRKPRSTAVPAQSTWASGPRCRSTEHCGPVTCGNDSGLTFPAVPRPSIDKKVAGCALQLHVSPVGWQHGWTRAAGCRSLFGWQRPGERHGPDPGIRRGQGPAARRRRASNRESRRQQRIEHQQAQIVAHRSSPVGKVRSFPNLANFGSFECSIFTLVPKYQAVHFRMGTTMETIKGLPVRQMRFFLACNLNETALSQVS